MKTNFEAKVSSRLSITFAALYVCACLASCATPSSRKTEDADYKGHGASSVDPKTLARFAPPPLDPRAVNFVRNIWETQSTGSGVLSPDGKTLYFTWGVTGVSQIWKMNGPMSFPAQMTSGADQTAVSMITTDGKYLLVSRDRAGEETPGLYLMPVEGGPPTVIHHQKDQRARAVWTNNSAEDVFYLVQHVRENKTDLWVYDIARKKSQMLFSNPGVWFVSDVYGDDLFLLGHATGARTAEYYVFGLTGRTPTPVLGQGEKEEYIVRFGATAQDLIVATNKFGDFKRLYLLREGKFTPITPDVKKDVEDVEIDHARFRLYVEWNEGGFSRLEVFNARDFKKVPFPKFPNADHVTLGKLSRFGRYANVSVGTSLEPRVNYVYDWAGGKLTQWTKSAIPEADVSKFAQASLESYPAKDGTQIPLLVWRPKSCASDPCAIVVHYHGGPEGQSRPGFNKLAQLYVSAGFVFVEPNVRGSEGYGKKWLSADDGPKRLEVISDIEDAAIHLRKTFASGGRAPKIGVMGWSYGGYATMMAMSYFAGSYDAGVALVGMSNLRSFLQNTAPYRRALRATEYGDPDKDKVALEKLSPTTYLDRIKAPLMIVQGVSDPRVPAGEAIQLQSLLEKRGINAPLILFSDEGHGAEKMDNQVLEIGHTLEFFKKNLM